MVRAPGAAFLIFTALTELRKNLNYKNIVLKHFLKSTLSKLVTPVSTVKRNICQCKSAGEVIFRGSTETRVSK